MNKTIISRYYLEMFSDVAWVLQVRKNLGVGLEFT